MNKEEIEAKLKELAEEMSRLSEATLTDSNCLGARITIDVINFMGHCQAAIEVETKGNKAAMEKLGDVSKRIMDNMSPELKAELDKVMGELGMARPSTGDTDKPMNIDEELAKILAKNKKQQEPGQ